MTYATYEIRNRSLKKMLDILNSTIDIQCFYIKKSAFDTSFSNTNDGICAKYPFLPELNVFGGNGISCFFSSGIVNVTNAIFDFGVCVSSSVAINNVKK